MAAIPPLSSATTSASTESSEPISLPAPLAALATTKSIEVRSAKAGESLSGVWKSISTTMSLADFQKLNGHLIVGVRQGGEALEQDDAIAMPVAVPLAAPVDVFAPGSQPAGSRLSSNAAAASFKETAGAYANNAAAGFFHKVGKDLIDHADANMARLGGEQDEVGANHSGLTRELVGGLACAGGFMGETVHGLERLAGMAIQAVAISGNEPERVFAQTIQSVKTTSVGDAVSGAARVAEGMAKTFVENYEKRGLTCAILKTALVVGFGRGVGRVSKAKVIDELAQVAEAVAGKQQSITATAAAVKKVVKNEKALAGIAAVVSRVAPVADATLMPAVQAARVNAAATMIHNAPPAEPTPTSPAAVPVAAGPALAAPASSPDPSVDLRRPR